MVLALVSALVRRLRFRPSRKMPHNSVRMTQDEKTWHTGHYPTRLHDCTELPTKVTAKPSDNGNSQVLPGIVAIVRENREYQTVQPCVVSGKNVLAPDLHPVLLAEFPATAQTVLAGRRVYAIRIRDTLTPTPTRAHKAPRQADALT
jgi:hypothetical protein